MPTARERATQWKQEHPNHVHKFVYRHDTMNRHCACGAWMHHLDGRIRETYDQEESDERTAG